MGRDVLQTHYPRALGSKNIRPTSKDNKERFPMHFSFAQAFVMATVLVLSGCGLGEDTVALNVTGVDYAGKGIKAFTVEDPDDPKNHGGGFSITPYSAGGIQCCYQVPEEWHEGMKVEVVVQYPLEGETGDEISASYAKRKAAGTLEHTIEVEIPEYKTPARGTLWVQFLPDKQAKVVISDLDPPHEDFPGDVKGWPEPSGEYRIKLINSKIKVSAERLSRSMQYLKQVQANDTHELEQHWRIYNEISAEKLSDYHGSDDPKFKAFLVRKFKERIRADKQTIRQLEEIKP